MIRVINRNFQAAVVAEHMLDGLIADNKIIAFKRADGWVVVGRGAVRRQYSRYMGTERRKMVYGNEFSMR